MADNQATLDEVYEDRNLLVMLLCAYNSPRLPRMPYGTVVDPNEPDWPVVIFELPTGQVSWHLPKVIADMMDIPEYDGEWDGHTTAEKRDRVRQFIVDVKSGKAFDQPVGKRPGFRRASELTRKKV